jgi:hypothetical protein
MKRQFIFGTMLSAALAVGVAAQQPPAGTTPPGSPTTDSDRAAQSQTGQTMTLTGCLQAANAGAAGSPGAAGAPAGAAGASAAGQGRGGFILTNVSPAGSMATGATGPGAPTGNATPSTTGTATGTAGRSSASGAATASAASIYRLMGGESQNLQQYVGQRVEVTGTTGAGMGSASSPTAGGASSAGAATAGAPTTGAGTPAGTAGAPGTTASGSSQTRGQGQALRVTSVRPTGEQCNQ